jgi:hypothetical protein
VTLSKFPISAGEFCTNATDFTKSKKSVYAISTFYGEISCDPFAKRNNSKGGGSEAHLILLLLSELIDQNLAGESL